jgi:hypothetical protein
VTRSSLVSDKAIHILIWINFIDASNRHSARMWFTVRIWRVVAAVIVAFAGSHSLSAAPQQKAPANAPMSAAQLDQLVAPIALYPDPLVAQILIAATYPLEIVEADRWLRISANAALKQGFGAKNRLSLGSDRVLCRFLQPLPHRGSEVGRVRPAIARQNSLTFRSSASSRNSPLMLTLTMAITLLSLRMAFRSLLRLARGRAAGSRSTATAA